MPESAFVGRKRHIEQFRKLLTSPKDSPYILNLRGPGGIGKTKILQHVVEICSDEAIPNTGIIDFYGIEMSSRITAAANKIAKSLKNGDKGGPFEKYWLLRQKFEAQETRAIEQEMLSQFINSLLEWTKRVSEKGKKGVIIFDTFEAIKYTVVENHVLNEWIPKLKDSVVIISGRQEKGEINFPEEIRNLIEDAPVEKFSKYEAVDYLKERKVWEIIEQDGVGEELFHLTNRKPLLLALSADWIASYTVFPSTTPKNLIHGVTQSDFEKKLVENLPNVIEKPENEFLPYMAHLIRPFDTELIRFLNPDISEADAEAILNNLNELSFIKKIDEDNGSAYWFQDELRLLFHNYVFSDRKWDRVRQDVSRRMLQFHDKKIEEARQRGDILEEQRIIARRLYHEIYLDPIEGINKFQVLFQNVRERLQFGYASMLLGPVRYTLGHLPEQQRYMFDLAEERWMRDMGDPERAEERFLELLGKHGDNLERSPFIYNALGICASMLGRFKEALDYHNKSLNLRQNKEDIANEEWNIGQIKRLIGEWEEAIIHFKKAHELSLSQEELNLNRIAIILSDLGRVFGLVGKYEAGIGYCNQAIKIFEKIKSKERMAMVKVIRGDIYRRISHYDEALQDIQEAILFTEESDYQNLAIAYFSLGYAQWYKGVMMNNQELLRESVKSFETSINIARKYHLLNLLPASLHEVSEVYWLLDLKENARKSNIEAYEKAEQAHDVHYAVNSLVKMAEFDYLDNKYDSIPSYSEKLKHEFKDKGYKFPLFYGRMERILADIAFSRKEYNNAIHHYSEGLYLIAQHGGYGKYTVKKELENIQHKLQLLPFKIALNYYKNLKKYWTEKGLDKTNPEIITWVDDHLNTIILQLF